MENKKHARRAPEWLTRGVMYQIFLRAFSPEGTLKAATDKLPEVAGLGVDLLYLCPICLQDDDLRRQLWSPRQKRFDNPRNPYRIKDFYAIDPEYGSDADLRTFVQTAHTRGMRVLLDIVFMHCGPAAVFMDEHPDFVKRAPGGTVIPAAWGFPALNFESPTLCDYLWRNLEYWITEFDVDGYRCDASDGVPLDFWETARTRLERLKPEIIMLAEGHRNADQILAFDMNYAFTAVSAIHKLLNQSKPASSLRQTLASMTAEFPQGTRFIRYIDNHDIAHDTSHGILRQEDMDDKTWQDIVDFTGISQDGRPPGSRIDKAWGTKAVDALLALCFTLDGVPFLYNGQEVADTAAHSIYGKAPIDWANGGTAGGKARRSLVKRLCAMRHAERTLSDGSLTWLDNTAPEAVLSFVRARDSEHIVVLVNISNNPVKTTVSNSPENLKPLLSEGTSITGDEAILAPFGFFVGKVANP